VEGGAAGGAAVTAEEAPFASGVAFGPAHFVAVGAEVPSVDGVLPEPEGPEGLRALVAAAPAPGSALGLPYEPQARPVARYPATTGEGHEVTVCVTRNPSVAYELHCPALGLHLATGSDSEATAMAHVVDAIAAAVADGMLAPIREGGEPA
jgi:hypothetical protein